MNADPLEHLKYPVGRFEAPASFTTAHKEAFITVIREFPALIRSETAHLSADQLETPYRPEGWSIRQVVHHCADSHLNAFSRFKMALTEDMPVIKPYFEDRWANLADYQLTPISVSLDLLQALHIRWTNLLSALKDEDWTCGYIHPEYGRKYPLSDALALYAWHCRHHLAHITTLKQSKGWK